MRIVSKLLVLFIILTGVTFAQTIDEILEKHFEAIGQEYVLQKNQLTAKGKIVQGGMEIPFVSYIKRPASFRSEGTFQGMSFIQTYNGETGWSLNPFMGQSEPQPMTAEELDRMEFQADFDGPYYNYKEKGHKVELAGTETMDDIEVYVIKLTRDNGDVVTSYLDAENYVILKSESKMKMQGVDVETETIYSNYKYIDDKILQAYEIETKANGQTMMQMVFEEISFDTEIDDALFGKPEPAAQSPEGE